MKDPHSFAENYVFRWEDGKQTDPARTHSMRRDDPGNWSSGKQGVGNLIGSNHGVTPPALASYRRVSVSTITVDVMHALTLAEAADIAVANYYRGPGLNVMPWSPLMASVMDFGWGAGPTVAKRHLQKLIGTAQDGQLGPTSRSAHNAFVASHGMEESCRLWAAERIAFYQSLNRPQFVRGWTNRTNYFLPGDPEGWWDWFNG